VQGFGGQARFVEENYGESALAKRFGVTRYPVLFVDDVLVAKPKDFGFYGRGEGKDEGRYTPLRSAASHDRLRADLSRVIELLLAGRRDAAAAAVQRPEVAEIAALPEFTLADLEGRPVSREDLAGRAVLVEFWATWCPPCRGTLGWLGDLRRRHGDRLVVLAPALESDEADVRRVAAGIDAPLRWAMGSPDLARAFGDVSAMPTLLLFDGQGKRVASFYGAPPGLHDEVEATLEPLLK
jgi:cytochrome c biogenesis protein CcmG, thiol:disulfide interchange protein DsbE